VQLEMQLEVQGQRIPFYQNTRLQFAGGQFVIEGVPAGLYHWRLRYPMAAQSPLEPPRTVTESGTFELHVLGETAATKP
jgi:hypothetical protein